MVEIEEFSVATSKKQLKANNGSSGAKEKDKEKHIPGLRKHLLDASKREAAAAKRMQDLMRHFGTILNQARWALRLWFSIITHPLMSLYLFFEMSPFVVVA